MFMSQPTPVPESVTEFRKEVLPALRELDALLKEHFPKEIYVEGGIPNGAVSGIIAFADLTANVATDDMRQSINDWNAKTYNEQNPGEERNEVQSKMAMLHFLEKGKTDP